MLRDDGQFTELEAKVLDICLVLHAEHGGGNNSTFTNHVVTSSGTDTYSAMAASIASLKGPKHGGANLKVQEMFADIKANCKDWDNKEEICAYLIKFLINKHLMVQVLYMVWVTLYTLILIQEKLYLRALRKIFLLKREWRRSMLFMRQ